MSPRRFAAAVLVLAAVSAAVWAFAARPGGSSRPDLIWGAHGGARDGAFHRPRAAAIDPQGRIYVVDFTARIQVYDSDGQYLGVTWRTPDFRNGRPSGLGIDRDGNLLVADSHYHCVRVYDAAGSLLKTLGGTAGSKPGEWGYVSDCVQDADGFYYVAEFGLNDRVTKLDSDGRFVACWGANGQAPGEFNRLRGLAIGPDGLLYAADACNHRVQVFTRAGEFVRLFGGAGTGPGQMSYPYDLAFGPGGELYVVERGNHRVQKFTADGKLLGTWGTPGSGPGQLADPWAVVVDRRGRVHVIDTENHRVQRAAF